MLAFWWEKCLLPSSSSSCSLGWLSHNKLGAAWSCHWHSLSWSSYLICFSLTLEALRRKSDISCSFPWHRPWVCSTAEQWEHMQRRHSPGPNKCREGRTQWGLENRDRWDLSCTEQCHSQRSWTRLHLSAANRKRLLLFCLFSWLQVQTGDPKALFPSEVWSADGESPRDPIPACPEWWNQLFTSLYLLLCPLASLIQRSA